MKTIVMELKADELSTIYGGRKLVYELVLIKGVIVSRPVLRN